MNIMSSFNFGQGKGSAPRFLKDSTVRDVILLLFFKCKTIFYFYFLKISFLRLNHEDKIDFYISET